MTVTGPNRVSYLQANGKVVSYELDPSELGFEGASISELKGDDAPTNAKIMRGVLSGETNGAKRDVVLLNSAAAFMAAGKVDNMPDGVAMAKDIIDSGKAMAKLEKLIEYSQGLVS